MNTYVEGWQLGLKAIAIYRDGSKRSAPLNTQEDQGHGRRDRRRRAIADLDAVLNDKTALEAARRRARESEIAELRKKADEPVRRRMPETRVAINHKFEIAGHKGYLTVGLFEDGQPGELFIQMNKEGSTIGGLMDTIATLTCISLQYGVPLETPREEVRLPALRAVRLHQEPRHPQRHVASPTTSSAGSAASSSRATRKPPARTAARPISP